MNRTKSFRRQQEKRAKQRAKTFCRIAGLDATMKQINLYATDRKPCSCFACRGERYKREASGEVKQ